MLQDPIHVIIVSSDYYIPYVSVLIRSMVDNKNNDDNLIIHIVSPDLKQETKDILNKTFKDVILDYLDVKPALVDDFENCTLMHIKTNICNYKLKFAEILDLDKAICLEGDMVVLGSLSPLYNMDISSVPMAAVPDPICSSIQEYYDIPAKYKYVNTGFFLANFKYWRKQGVAETFKKINEKYKKTKYFTSLLDQNIFNIAFYKNIKYLSYCYNFCAAIEYNNVSKDQLMENEPLVVHWADWRKPWEQEVNLSNLFWYYAQKTPYYGVILQRMMKYNAQNIENSVKSNSIGICQADEYLYISYVMQHPIYFRFKKFIYKLKKSLGKGKYKEKYRIKHAHIKTLLKKAKEYKKNIRKCNI